MSTRIVRAWTLRVISTAALLSLGGLAACSAAGDGESSLSQNGTGGSSSGTGGGGSDVEPPPDIDFNPPDQPGTRDPNDQRNVPVRKKTCDAAGENCTCLRLALLGTLDSAANAKDTKPFIDWLNGNSGGTATVTMVNTKPTLDEAFLSQYDILLVANVNGWTFSAAEVAAVQSWSLKGGGGIVALTGFVSTAGEPAATSQLMQFAGVSFTSPQTANGGQGKPVYYKGGSTDLKQCLAWSGSSDAIITSPIKFTAQTGSLEKLTSNLNYVGAFVGWNVVAPAGATVVATDPVTGKNMAVATEVSGAGRVFAFGDEWVIFANQWEPAGKPNNQQQDQYNPCWVAASGDEPSFFHSVQTLYQTKQFWYNVINWVAPPNECNFVIKDDDVVIR
jgi:hypothetical protein